MKRIVLVLTLLTAPKTISAQVVKEIFQQKKTQIEYLANQIAALKVYIEFLQKGYRIADQGLSLIGQIKDGDLKLHRDYFASLKKIKPIISSDPRVRDIADLYALSSGSFTGSLSKARANGLFTQPEMDYMQRVYDRLMDDCSSKLDELALVLQPGKLEMKDDERIRRIDQIFAGMQNNYNFSKGFVNAALVMANSRKTAADNGAIIEKTINH